MTALKTEVDLKLQSVGVPAETIEQLDPLFTEDSEFTRPFVKVESPHQQLKFYREHFDFIVRWGCA